MRMIRRFAALLLVAAALVALAAVAGCGGSDEESSKDPTQRVPAAGGLRERVQSAATPERSAFPSPAGKTLAQVAAEAGAAGGPDLALASSIFTTGHANRFAFGLIDAQGQFRYAPTAVYV